MELHVLIVYVLLLCVTGTPPRSNVQILQSKSDYIENMFYVNFYYYKILYLFVLFQILH